jgi:hypothetical protein
MRNNIRKGLQIVTAIICLASGSAMAGTGFGVRIGHSTNSDVSQFHFGAHYSSKPLFGNFFARPSFEYGTGHDVKLLTANFDVIGYRIEQMGGEGALYFCGGPALVRTHVDPKWKTDQYNNSNNNNNGGYGGYNTTVWYYDPNVIKYEGTDWGISFVAGYELKRGFLMETRLGMHASGSTGKKITLGWTF